MVIRYYTNMVSQASRSIAAGIFIVGLLLMGFSVIIFALPRFFAYLAAIVFFIAALGCIATAVKMFWRQRKLENLAREKDQLYRKNVRVRIEQ